MALQVWLPLIGNLKNYGLAPSPLNFSSSAVYGEGKIGSQSYNTNTASTNSQWSSLVGLTTFSIAYWFKCTTDTPTAWADLWSMGVTTSGSTSALMRDERGAADYPSRVQFLFVKDKTLNGNTNTYYGTGYYTSANTWTHTVITKTPTEGKVYRNGQLITTIPCSNFETSPGALTGYLKLGMAGSNGFLNDFRVYDHCLSLAEVHELSLGLLCHYKLDEFYGVNVLSTNPTLTITGTASSVYSSYVYFDPQIKARGLLRENMLITVVYDYIVNSVSTDTQNTIWLYSQMNGSRLGPAISNTAVRTRTSGIQVEQFVVSSAQANYSDTFRIRWRLQGNAATDSITIKNMKVYLGSIDDTLFIHDSSGYGRDISVDFALEDFITKLDDPDYLEEFYEFYYDYTENDDYSKVFTSRVYCTDTPRYNSCFKKRQGFQSDTTYEGRLFGEIPFDGLTIAGWIKPTSLTANNHGIGFYCQTGAASRLKQFEIYTGSSGRIALRYGINNNTTFSLLTTKIMPVNEWHHYAATWKDNTCKFYFDGILFDSKTLNITTPIMAPNLGFIIGNNSTDYCESYYSDARCYATALSDDDIKALAQVRADVDKLGNISAFDYSDLVMNQITTKGIFNNNMCESFITLADGSIWQLLMFHRIDDGTNLFTQETALYSNDSGLYSRLKYIDSFIYDNKYEFYAIQDGVAHRWSQTNAPLTSTSVTDFISISGSPNGGICKCQSNTLLARTNTTSNWWNAIGCWTLYKGGIPGVGQNVVGKQYLALYARVNKIQAHLDTDCSHANQFYEY